MDLQSIILNKIKLKNRFLPLQFAIKEKIDRNNFAFVFDEVGCGKTIESGIVIWDTIKNGGKNVLIVAPSNLVFNWYNEMLSKFGLSFKIVEGTADAIDLYNRNSPINKIRDITNLCIVSYDSRANENSNAALDRLKQLSIPWDLVVLDEGHESKNESSNRYQTLKAFMARKVLFLSATPIKNLKEDFEEEFWLVSGILGNAGVQVSFGTAGFSPEAAIAFDLNYPISRNFKELLMGLDDFKQRNVRDIIYHIPSAVAAKLHEMYSGMELDAKRGCIFLFDRIFHQDQYLLKIYQSYKKNKYDLQDYDQIIELDEKISKLIELIDEINEANANERVVVFCQHREVVNYIMKMLVFKYGDSCVEAIHGESYLKEERKNRIFLLDKNDEEMSKKRVLVLSHNIGAVGINLSKFNHVINYELPYTPADLEQRFGRIDRITNSSEELNMYIFNDLNNQFDNVYFNRLVTKMILEVLPVLPSKNILFMSKRIKDVYLEMINALIRIQAALASMTGENDLSENPIINEISKHLEVIVSVNEKKVKIFDLKQQRNISLEELKKELNIMLQTVYTNIGISATDHLEQAVDEYVKSMSNTVSYLKDNYRRTMSFKALMESFTGDCNEQGEHNDFLGFVKKIDRLNDEVTSTSSEVIRTYKETRSIESFMDFLITEIQCQGVNENLIFSVLYGTWSVLVNTFAEADLSFESYMNTYNERIC